MSAIQRGLIPEHQTAEHLAKTRSTRVKMHKAMGIAQTPPFEVFRPGKTAQDLMPTPLRPRVKAQHMRELSRLGQAMEVAA
jgi:hypothetical protein